MKVLTRLAEPSAGGDGVAADSATPSGGAGRMSTVVVVEPVGVLGIARAVVVAGQHDHQGDRRHHHRQGDAHHQGAA